MTKILVIEDDTILADLYYHTFSLKGFDTYIAKDGVEGVEKTKELKPDLVFLDIMMPKMNGLEVLKILKSDDSTKDIRVIMLSNFSNEEQRNQALSLGALTYVIKSEFEPSEVVKLANDILNNTFTEVKK